MDFQEVVGNDDSAKHALIITKESHVGGASDGDPKGEPSSP